MTPPQTGPILLYDGECGVCGAAVRFILRWDRAERFRFAALDSPLGSSLRSRAGIPQDIDSLVIVEGEQGRVRSDAVLTILQQLGGPWHLLRLLGLVLPRVVRDALYDAVAARRRAWSARFGLQGCLIPTGRERERFL